jgi:hypothetical protein
VQPREKWETVMSEPIWSRRLAADVAAIVGYSRTTGGLPTALDADQIVAEIIEAFRYLDLRADKIRLVLNFARFLRSDQPEICVGSSAMANVIENLAALRDFVRFLKEKFGDARPADESEDWTDEEIREFAVASANESTQGIGSSLSF